MLAWDIHALCPMHFLSALLAFGVYFDDDEFEKPPSTKDVLKGVDPHMSRVQSIQKFSEFFVDIAFESLEIQQFKYSVQAVASLVAARRTLCIEPTWNPKLQEITGYSFSDVEE